MKCVECSKEQMHPVCADCAAKVMDRAYERGLPVVGKETEARRIGFDPRASKEGER